MKMGSAGLNNFFLLDQVKGHCARGNLLENVGTAIGPTGRHTGRCAFFMAFFTRLINKGTTFVIHIENPLESISPQTQDGVDSLVRIWFHAQGTLLAGCGAV